MGNLDWIESLFCRLLSVIDDRRVCECVDDHFQLVELEEDSWMRSAPAYLTEMMLLEEAKSEACSTAGEATQERVDPNEKPSCRAARRSRKIDDEDYSVLAEEWV